MIQSRPQSYPASQAKVIIFICIIQSLDDSELVTISQLKHDKSLVKIYVDPTAKSAENPKQCTCVHELHG